ncbi:MAG: arsenate reductase (glutaredoxin) [Gammaproteobacteria bacterium]|nr:arsenate reductase (glutaredoxin) [Gammaproteobacteria bacterium]
MLKNVTIFHNPRCSKSRQTLQLLQDRGIRPTIIEYLRDPPSVGELADLLNQLDLSPREVMRRKEATYKDLGLDATDLDDAQLIEAIHRHPILLERPIVISDGKAAIGRPPENVLAILPNAS